MASPVTTTQTILVVGGGISGITAALETAEVGHDVVLVEKNPYLGGRVAQFNRYFPKLCPPYCGLEINFRRMRQNPRIRFFTMAEVEAIAGQAGAYTVTVRQQPRYVNERCTCCGKCSEAATTEIPNPFDYGMGKIKAAYLPHELAFPMRYVVDPSIIGTKEAQQVQASCPYGAIDLTMQPQTFTLEVASIVWATGWKPYPMERLNALGGGVYPNVINNVMMERLAAENGPTRGKLLRPSDGREAKRVAFVQCAGSRDENHLAYCSGICCMASLKQACYVRERYPDAEVVIFYIDIRADGRYDDFYAKVRKDPGVTFIKSKVARIEEDPESHDPILIGENTMTCQLYRHRADLVVLATGMVPNTADAKIPFQPASSASGGGAGPEYDSYGFVVPGTGADGIFASGCAKEPVDVSTSALQSTAAALRAIQTVASPPAGRAGRSA